MDDEENPKNKNFLLQRKGFGGYDIIEKLQEHQIDDIQ